MIVGCLNIHVRQTLFKHREDSLSSGQEIVGYQTAKDKARPMWQINKKRRRALSSHVLNFTSNLRGPSGHRRELIHEEGHIQDRKHDHSEGIDPQKEH